MQSNEPIARNMKKSLSIIKGESKTSTVVSNVRGRSILGKSDKNVSNVATGIDKKTISDQSTVRISHAVHAPGAFNETPGVGQAGMRVQ